MTKSHLRAALVGFVLALALLLVARHGRSQCSASSSSCLRCHEAQGAMPVLDDGSEWHRAHAFGDVCLACHGGDGRAASATSAHLAMTAPLADPQASCGPCHTDAIARAERYRAATATSKATDPAVSAYPPRPARASAPTHRADAAVALAVALVGLVGGGLVLHHERGRPPIALADLAGGARRSPAVFGSALGVVAATSIAFAGRPLAASAAFDRLASYAGRVVAPSSPYFRFTVPPAIDASVWLVLGVLVGAFFSAALGDTVRVQTIPAHEWIPAFGPRRLVRAFVAFVGGAIVQFAAGVAGGCTSGLAISGGIVLAPAAFLFMAGMFAGGIPTARIVHRRRGRR